MVRPGNRNDDLTLDDRAQLACRRNQKFNVVRQKVPRGRLNDGEAAGKS
jgi:hypothetical protein